MDTKYIVEETMFLKNGQQIIHSKEFADINEAESFAHINRLYSYKIVIYKQYTTREVISEWTKNC